MVNWWVVNGSTLLTIRFGKLRASLSEVEGLVNSAIRMAD